MKVGLFTADELAAIIETAVASALAKARPSEPSEIMTAEQVAELVQVCVETVPRLVRNAGLPEIRAIGNHRRFRRSEVIEWMTARRKSA